MRLRYDNAFGTLGASQAAGDGTITFAAALTYADGIQVPTLTGGSTIDITVEPNSTNFEVERITAYTQGALTATVSRGISGSAKPHLSGVAFGHNPTAGGDFNGGTPSLALGTTNTAGTSGTPFDAASGVAVFDTTAPVTQNYSDAAATGSAAVAARRDHKHGMPASTGVTWPLTNTGDEAFQPNSIAQNVLTLRNQTGFDEGVLVTPSGSTGSGFGFVASTDGAFTGTGQTWAVTLGTQSGVGHLLVAIVALTNYIPSSTPLVNGITDDGGNHWVRIQVDAGDKEEVWYTNTGTLPANTVTVAGNYAPNGFDANAGVVVRVLEFSGSAFPAFDGSSEHTQSSATSLSSNATRTPTTTTDVCIGLAAWIASSTLSINTESSGFTANTPSVKTAGLSAGSATQLHTAYQILTTASAQNYSPILSSAATSSYTVALLFRPNTASSNIPYVGLLAQSPTKSVVGVLVAGKNGGTVQVTGVFTAAIGGGALPTVTLSSGSGSQISTTRDVMLSVPVTYTPTAGAAATCLVELSPDGGTYSALGTETVPLGTALDSFILSTRLTVPAGWYVRLTVTNATIGTGTFW